MFWFRRKHAKQAQPAPGQEPEWVPLERPDISAIPYVVPSTTQEIDRLDFQHYAITSALQTLHIAPIDRPQKILDVGSGTGRWGYEIATAFPNSQVMGVDITDTHTNKTLRQPDNYTFIRANILEGLPFADNSFDYIHQRLLVAAIPSIKWPAVIQDLVRITRPDGWIELIDSDGNGLLNSGPKNQQSNAWWKQLIEQRGIDPNITKHLGELLEINHLLNVNRYILDIPVGNWGGRIGKLMATDIQSGLPVLKQLYQTHLGVKERELDQVISEMPLEWESYRAQMRLYITYGQKPVD